LEHAMEQMNFSARAHDRILKVSRTIADLAGKQDITGNEVLEAIQFRSLDRRLFERNPSSHPFPNKSTGTTPPAISPLTPPSTSEKPGKTRENLRKMF